ncbi:hypothetical protein [Rossellomorea marisflavi]|uniref:hypothetical protein n=1 Tax=Rossellomorea marisflavi TaxID=189381 RepID=UPI00064EC08F|nr:hypothetical protein [Rossellomorea marisflavi]KML07873.1 hypothetical protein VL06_03130 [Rossellomorea marisflavi]
MLNGDIKKNIELGAIILAVAIITPIMIGLILNIPTGNLTIGDEASWVSFFGSYIGGIVGGIVALIILSTQLHNERRKYNNSQRSFLSAAKIKTKASVDRLGEIKRKNRYRVLLREEFRSLSEREEITYYSIVRYGGPDVIINCHFEVIIGEDENFFKIDKINTWLDYFEKDEEIFIPLVSRKLGIRNFNPFVKEIKVIYHTVANEKICFFQSEKEKNRIHTLEANGTVISEHKIEKMSFSAR